MNGPNNAENSPRAMTTSFSNDTAARSETVADGRVSAGIDDTSARSPTIGVADATEVMGPWNDPAAKNHEIQDSQSQANALLTENRFDERYRADKLLGQGGMGEVRLHRDQLIGRNVAVKTIRPQLINTGDYRARFLREARIQGQLEHPAIVPVHDVGLMPDGRLYFTMKEITGQTLRSILRALKEEKGSDVPRKNRRRLLSAFSRLCLAIDYAHQQGVAHRDIKPENVMLGSFGEVWVLDWGMSSAGVQPDSESGISGEPLTVTQDGLVFGTPGYAAPEQLKLVAGEIGPKCDVYTLGVILFELLTFKPFHTGGNLNALLWSAAMGGALTVEDDHGLEPELIDLIRACTQRDPNARSITTRDIHDAVEHFLDGVRDLALRQDLAHAHLEIANHALQHTGADNMGDRQDALRALGQSLALDPGNEEPLDLLANVLNRPVTYLPEAVEARIEKQYQQRLKTMVAWGKLTMMVSILLLWPILRAIGIRESGPVNSFFALAVGMILLAVYLSRSDAWQPRVIKIAIVLSTVTMGALTVFFGPLIVTPLFILCNTAAWTFVLPKQFIRFTIGTALLVAIVPVLCETVGTIRFYSFDGSAMLVRSSVIEMSPALTIPFIALSTVAALGILAVIGVKLRATIDANERRVEFMNWQLQEIFPSLGGRLTNMNRTSRQTKATSSCALEKILSNNSATHGGTPVSQETP